MNIVQALPPMFVEILAAFPNANRQGVIFSWGTDIYVPGGGTVRREVLAHERVHGQRQLALPGQMREWWTRYIADPEFRLEEELSGHIAEYQDYCRHVADQNKRVAFLMKCAERLASPLYGDIITEAQAMKKIRGA